MGSKAIGFATSAIFKNYCSQVVMPGIILYHGLLNNTLTSWMQYLILSKMAFVSPKSIQFSSIYGKFYKQDYNLSRAFN